MGRRNPSFIFIRSQCSGVIKSKGSPVSSNEWPPADAPLEHLEETVAVAFLTPAIAVYLLPDASDEQQQWADDFYLAQNEAFQSLDTIARQSLQEALGYKSVDAAPGIQYGYREVPPRTGGAIGPESVVVILGHINDVVQQVGGWVELGQLLIGLARHGLEPMKVFARKRREPEERATAVFTVQGLKAICYLHAARNYGVTESEVLACRHETSPYTVGSVIVGSDKHPVGPERHRIELVLGDRSLIYETDSLGRLEEHFEYLGGRKRSLFKGSLLEES